MPHRRVVTTHRTGTPGRRRSPRTIAAFRGRQKIARLLRLSGMSLLKMASWKGLSIQRLCSRSQSQDRHVRALILHRASTKGGGATLLVLDAN